MTILSPDFVISGVPVMVSAYVPPGTYCLIDGTAVFHSRAELDETIRRLNLPLCLRLPTRAMRGNARRRALLAKVRERTQVICPSGPACCIRGEWARRANPGRWECPLHFNGS